jgi:hypothetical protein
MEVVCSPAALAVTFAKHTGMPSNPAQKLFLNIQSISLSDLGKAGRSTADIRYNFSLT